MKDTIFFILIIWILLLKCTSLQAQSLMLSDDSQYQDIDIGNYASVCEETAHGGSAADYLNDTACFNNNLDIKNLPVGKVYWIRIHLSTAQSLRENQFFLSFSNLTYVDLFLQKNNSVQMIHKQNGGFRPSRNISKGDDRFSFQVNFHQDAEYILLLRVNHVKGYSPFLDFHLQGWRVFNQKTNQTERLNAILQGAIFLLLIYISITLIITRFRPYLWVFLFLFFLGLYSYALQSDFIDRFFANDPSLGWSLGPILQRMGTLSFYMLLIDFLDLRRISQFAFRGSIAVMVGVVIMSVTSFYLAYYGGNFEQSNRFTFVMGSVNITFLVFTFTRIWHRIDRNQRFLVLGILFFVVGILILIFGALIFKERLLVKIPIITQFSISLITIVFLTGMRLKLKRFEEERIELLEENNRFQKNYTLSIEEKVHERTMELQLANNILEDQRMELIDKNSYIETLIDEVNHRVKNNLQLLYSLGSMKLAQTGATHQEQTALQDMRSRIKSMILVNQLLSNKSGDSLNLTELVHESVFYLKHIYDPQERVYFDIDIRSDHQIMAKYALPLGLILTELLTNSFKYAFEDQQSAGDLIGLKFWEDNGMLIFEYWDNGKAKEHKGQGSSLGIPLIKDLTRQLKGEMSLQREFSYHYHFQFKPWN